MQQIELMDHQKEAIRNLSSGKVLYGGVGLGKSAAALGYYVENEEWRDLYVITTAKKRDSLDWEGEAIKFGIGTEPGLSLHGRLTVDSWNNIDRYTDVRNAFFIFDEQRVVGHGAWVKAFLKICRAGNHWILLSATPGDTWMDYAPIFIANGYYKNRTEFIRKHVVYKPYLRFPVIDHYINTDKLELLRNEVLVEMPYLDQEDRRVLNWMMVPHDEAAYRRLWKDRWNDEEDRPIKDAAELFRLLRRCVNSDPSRLEMCRQLLEIHPRIVIFYNFDYELEILRELKWDVKVYEYNGHRKDDNKKFEDEERWVYLVQYTAGAEAWNCTKTNAMIFYSLTYSYKNFEQAQGRIDRLTSDFDQLYYYIFLSNSSNDRKIRQAITDKRAFNEKRALAEMEKEDGVMDEEERKFWEERGGLVEICQI